MHVEILQSQWLCELMAFHINLRETKVKSRETKAIGSSFCILARAMLPVIAGYKTATLLFNKMHFCIFRAPMLFFDSTPSGRIINRASTDQSAVDTDIPYQIGSFAFSMIQLF